MAETKTRSDLITKAFRLLTGTSADVDVSDPDSETIDGFIDPLLAQLAGDSIVYVPDAEEIPNEYFLPLTRLLANVAGPEYGTPINAQIRMADEAELRRLTALRPTYEVARAEYF